MLQTKFVNTTLGDLIVAITDEAKHYTHNMCESYALTASILTDILDCRDHHPGAQRNLDRIERCIRSKAKI